MVWSVSSLHMKTYSCNFSKLKVLSLNILLIGCMSSCLLPGYTQTFTRTVVTTALNRPWSMVYAPDNMLWITQSGGRVSRVDPNTGVVTTIYTAPDYFPGDPSQTVVFPCSSFSISAGTYGLALHPNFTTEPFVYHIYSYNAGSQQAPISKYKVRRFTWNATTQ